MQQTFHFRDFLIVAMLGEVVGLFGYFLFQSQRESVPAAIVQIPLAAFVIGVSIGGVLFLRLFFFIAQRSGKLGIAQLGKFLAVGSSNTAIDWGLLNLLLVSLSVPPSPVLYAGLKAVAFAVATLNSFFWNRFWAFSVKGAERIGVQAAEFYGITISGMLVNVGVATLVVTFGPSDSRLWGGIIAPAAATIFSMAWNFVGYKFFVFRAKETRSP